MSLIDREKLKEAFKNNILRFDVYDDEFDEKGFSVDLVYRMIDSVPTVDAVEVVRCKDCDDYDSVHWYCKHYRRYKHSTDFCSMGERKDGEQDENE